MIQISFVVCIRTNGDVIKTGKYQETMVFATIGVLWRVFQTHSNIEDGAVCRYTLIWCSNQVTGFHMKCPCNGLTHLRPMPVI